MGGQFAHLADFQPLDEDILRQSPAHGISLLASGVCLSDDASAIRTFFRTLVLGGGIAGGGVCDRVLYRRRFFVVRAESGVWDSALPQAAYLVAQPDLVVDHAARLLGFSAGRLRFVRGGCLADAPDSVSHPYWISDGTVGSRSDEVWTRFRP